MIEKLIRKNSGVMQPSKLSRYLSIAILFLYLATFGLLAYLPSALKGEITDTEFTVSQSLAFSIKPAFVVVFTIATLLFAYLIYYRGHNFMWTRLFFLLVIYAFIITILWVTTFYSMTDHYILAAFIFLFTVLFIMLNNFVIYNGLKNHTLFNTLFLLGTPILAILGLLGLLVSKVALSDIEQLFPSLENYMIVIKSLSVFALGFI
jgi:hypothetical protein